mmetsp:Transcript_15439/g.27282  ORF Transcript_15439/g.27282 Transcript_15439/m.27282 type:complete len:159 (-) Transcript_15439:1105-1581(-)
MTFKEKETAVSLQAQAQKRWQWDQQSGTGQPLCRQLVRLAVFRLVIRWGEGSSSAPPARKRRVCCQGPSSRSRKRGMRPLRAFSVRLGSGGSAKLGKTLQRDPPQPVLLLFLLVWIGSGEPLLSSFSAVPCCWLLMLLLLKEKRKKAAPAPGSEGPVL